MIDTQKPDQDDPAAPARSIEAALPTMKERAQDHVHLTFLVDDFQRALDLNMEIVTPADKADPASTPASGVLRSGDDDV